MSSLKSIDHSLQNQILSIYRRYPSIFSHEHVSICSRMYYPIAIVDILVEESVRQPFTPLEHIVIELIKSGMTDYTQLAATIGLPDVFVKETVQMLEDEEMMKDFILTTKGEYCYAQKIKFTADIQKQSIQYDPLLQEVLTEQQHIDEKYLVPLRVTNNAISHFLPQANIELDKIQNMFTSKLEDDEIVTVKNLKEVMHVKLYFVEVVTLLFNLVPHPFIFFPDEKGHCVNMLTISEANLSYYNDDIKDIVKISREKYYDVWLSVKQIKDEMKRTQDNQILRRDIKAKISQHIELCNEEHTSMTESGISLVLEFNKPFIFNLNNFNVIKSLEWTAKHIPFLVLEQEPNYNNLIAYSECYDGKVYDTSKLIFQLEQLLDESSKLYMLIGSHLLARQTNTVTATELNEILILIHEEQKKLRKSL